MPGILDPSEGGSARPVELAGDISVAALLLSEGRCSIDHGVLRGFSRPAPGTGGRVFHVWVAFSGSQFHGLAACQAHEPLSHANAMAAATRGTVDVTSLETGELAMLRAFLQSCEPVRWDQASRSFKSALKRVE